MTMKEPQHTPAPWRIVACGTGEHERRSLEIYANVPSRKVTRWRAENPDKRQDAFGIPTIARLGMCWNGSGKQFGPIDGLIDQEEIDANARLIEAAPDYDAAARLAIEDAGPLDADDLSQGVVISEAAFDALRAAIAKATP